MRFYFFISEFHPSPHTPRKHLHFMGKELSKVLFKIFHKIEIPLHLKNSVKMSINECLKRQLWVNMADELKLPNEAITIFRLLTKETC